MLYLIENEHVNETLQEQSNDQSHFCEIKNTKNVIREYYKTRKIRPH